MDKQERLVGFLEELKALQEKYAVEMEIANTLEDGSFDVDINIYDMAFGEMRCSDYFKLSEFTWSLTLDHNTLQEVIERVKDE